MKAPELTVVERIAGGLLGVAAGDALGATLEFVPPRRQAHVHPLHTEIVGGGAFGWRAGEGTDDTDLTWAVVQAYLDGYTVDRAADRFLAWFEGRPRDVGGTTAAALRVYRQTGDSSTAGAIAAQDRSMTAGNGSLMRCIATGLVRADPVTRAREAAAISAITHADARCTDACIAYCDLVAGLMDGLPPVAAVESVLRDSPVRPDVRRAVGSAPGRALHSLNPSGFVLDTLTIGVWALCCRAPLEDVLIEVVNLGGDADTTGAVAGGLLGVRDGAASIPTRWRDVLKYRMRLIDAAAPLAALRSLDERALAAHRRAR